LPFVAFRKGNVENTESSQLSFSFKQLKQNTEVTVHVVAEVKITSRMKPILQSINDFYSGLSNKEDKHGLLKR